MELIERIQALLDQARVDGPKWYDQQNKSAGIRTRKLMQSIVVSAKQVRKSITINPKK